MRIWALFSAFVVAACAVTTVGAAAEKGIYTLYRNSIVTPSMLARGHIASDGAAYSRENCEQARALFTNQAGVKMPSGARRAASRQGLRRRQALLAPIESDNLVTRRTETMVCRAVPGHSGSRGL